MMHRHGLTWMALVLGLLCGACGDEAKRSRGSGHGAEPEPASHVPQGCGEALSATGFTEFYDGVRCLFEGPDAVQKEVASEAIEPRRVAVMQGRVLGADGDGLAGVRVTVLGAPEFGFTETRAGGYYDIALNGGGQVALRFELSRHVAAQRHMRVDWQRFAHLDDLVLIELAAPAAPVSLGSMARPVLVKGRESRDQDGVRRNAVLVRPGTSATAEGADGGTSKLDELQMRITDVTVGAYGSASMPGQLPETSAFTYAVDLSAVGAETPGTAVRFDPPLINYVDNFLKFPAGTLVPTGYYDEERDLWVASENGVVLDIVEVADGVASIDANGDGEPDDAAELEALGIDQAELASLGAEYEAGQSLWRTPIPHFSIWDCNWPFGPPDDAVEPDVGVDGAGADDCNQTAGGSVIGCESQTLGESLGLTGVPFSLHYASDRMPGRLDRFQLDVRLSGSEVPASLKRIDVKVEILGQVIEQTFPGEPGQHLEFVWNGRDAWGRIWQGRQPASVRVGYVYDGAYENTGSFGSRGTSEPITGDKSREELTIWSSWTGLVGGVDNTALTIGGFSPSIHHQYDRHGGMLLLGDGRQRSAERLGSMLELVAGDGTDGFAGDSGPAVAAALSGPHGLAVAADGTTYLSDESNDRIRRIRPDGVIETFAGTGEVSPLGDGGPALDAVIDGPLGLALARDGTLYVAERYTRRVRAIAPDGTIRTVAGGGSVSGVVGDGGSALDVSFGEPHGLALGADGSLYVADSEHNLIRCVRPDGTISTVAGGGLTTPTSGIRATEVSLGEPLGVAVDQDGSVYFTEYLRHRVSKVDRSGLLTIVAGTGTAGFSGDGGPAILAELDSPHDVQVGRDSAVYISDEGNSRVRRVLPDGTIETLAGGGTETEITQGTAPKQASLRVPRVGFIHEDGSYWIVDYSANQIYRVAPPLPDSSGTDSVVVSDDGSELFVFDAGGRHLRTIDAVLGVVLVRFEYNADGRLVGVVDRNANRTEVEWDSSGQPSLIRGPYGDESKLQTTSDGLLASLENPAGEIVRMTYAAGGLLSTLTEANGDEHRFEFDSVGRLVRDEQPTGSYQTLTRVETDDGPEVTLRRNDARPSKHKVPSDFDPTAVGRSYESPSGRVVTRTGTRTESVIETATQRLEVTQSGDPRFGAQAIYPSRIAFTTGSLTLETGRTREVELEDPGDPLSVAIFRDTVTTNGRVETTTYDAAARTFVTLSPEGRSVTSKLDELGRVVSTQVAALEPTTFAYDARGRVTRASTGERVSTFEYDERGRLSLVVDPLGRELEIAYDAAGRVTRRTFDGRSVALTYDSNGLATALTTPAGKRHAFTWQPGSRLERYEPPAVAGVSGAAIGYGYDEFDALVSTGDLTISYEPDTGRVSAVDVGAYQVSYGYSDLTGQPISATSGDERVELAYDGMLPSGIEWTGAVEGTVAWEFDENIWLVSETAGGVEVVYARDDDGLLVEAGDESLVRDAGTGFVTATTLGTVRDSLEYDTLGELIQYEATGGGTVVYGLEDTHDVLGRVVTGREEIAGEVSDYEYSYDDNGRLVGVTRDGDAVERYTYDDDGNRLTAVTASGSVEAEYDEQDRLVTYGDARFAYTDRGFLASVADGGDETRYVYDALGNLREVTLPDGRVVEYVIDGRGARVGRRIDGRLVQGFLFGRSGQLVGELGPDGSSLVSRFVYASSTTVPDYMIKGGVTYRLLSDRVGSVRLVVSSTDGSVAQRLDYDSFGVVVADSAPGFQPFGFAGGLYDPDTSLVRFGARDYQPLTGRWTSKDPAFFGAGQTNLYEYVGSDPVNHLDPSGLLVDAIIDVGFIGYDLYRLAKDGNCNLGENLVALGSDVLGAVLPGITGLGAASRAGRVGSHVDDVARGACRGGVCPCFTADTLIDSDSGAVAIESVEIGERVGPESAECEAASFEGWSIYDLRMVADNGGVKDEFDIRLARAPDWTAQRLAAGDSVELSIAEFNLNGRAYVTGVTAAPLLSPGARCPVTGLVRHTSADMIRVDLANEATPLEVTRHHPLFSADRSDWVAAGELRPGEQLRTRDGVAVVERIGENPLPPVEAYNLEVLGEHQYFVHASRVLAHNTCATGGARPPSMSPPGAGRRGAFNEAKRQNGIPVSQQPSRTGPNYDRRGNVQPGRTYEFEVPTEGGGTRTVKIRDDAAGHDYGPGDPQNRGPHFNDPPENHYDY